jgi:NADPH2:quinone reductase
MTRIVQLDSPGGPDALAVAEVPTPTPGPGEILVRQTAAGINFVDVYHRTGLYPLARWPAVLGIEGVGVVLAVGSGVESPRPGARVAYAGEVGAYADARVLPAWRAIEVPDALDDETAAVALVRGLTVHMLESRVHAVARGTWALVHSAAGGLGNLLVRSLVRRGAVVIATVGSPEKVARAREAGAHHVIVGRDADFAAAVAELTHGRGVDVAYDGVGGTTLAKTLACVRPFGTVASFGQSGGPIPPLDVTDLGPRRSLCLARPSVMHYMSDRETYRRAAREVMDAGIHPTLGRAYALDDAAAAHRDLESGATTGASFLAIAQPPRINSSSRVMRSA